MKTFLKVALLSLALLIAPVGAIYAQDTPQITTTEDITTIDQNAPVVVQDATEVTSDTTVVVPVGNWISDLLSNATEIVGAAVLLAFSWMLKSVPKSVADLLRTMKAEQLLTRAVDYGLNYVKGATKDKSLSVDVGSKVVAEAAQYAVDQAPAHLIEWLGGIEAVKKMIMARLTLTEATDGQDVLDRSADVVVPK